MALHGKFVINDAYYSPLSSPGVGTFLVFSGNGAYRNRGVCGMIPMLRSQKIAVPCMRKLQAYGTSEVIANGKACP